jgi:UDP-N-acetylmuramoyl-tripeptide--D-alanyl-D-alanine ligase
MEHKRFLARLRSSKSYNYFRKARRWFKTEFKQVYARLKRRSSRATFIAVTGSSGKTTTVALLSHILSATRKVRTQLYDNEVSDTRRTIRSVTRQDDFVVLELGTGAPGQIQEMVEVARPNIGIITMVGLEHYSAFRGLEAVAKEKSSLVKVLPRDGLAFLNKDDPHVFPMSKLTDARVVTFGKSGADYSWDRLISTEPGKLAFALDYRDRSIILETRLTGAHNRLPVSAAAACALELGASESSVVDAIASFEPVFGRLSIHRIDGGPIFILDTYKAPYHSLQLALSVLRDCVAPRKRFVLGQISDYPGKPKPRYRDAYRAALGVADQVLFVGPASEKYAATGDEIELGKYVAFGNVDELSSYIKSSSVAGEVILVKSSQNLHLERIMLDWHEDVKCWPVICGRRESNCVECGLYRAPFSKHGGKSAKPRSRRR